ncbi:MAG TPA: DUF885 domain-containing protein, partial [Steroidobacteraceae bacterium]|nr:DUF885 domain-containing protein [Steroidobacteraceae bacterium]
RQQAQAFDPAPLTPSQRFERQYLISVTTSQLFWLDHAKAPFVNPAWYIDRLDPEVYLSRNYAPLATRMQAYIGYAQQIPRLAADIRANLRMPMAKTLLERGIEGFGGFATFYRKDVPKVFESIADPAAQKQLAQADTAAAQAMDGLRQWLQSQRKSATDHYALGEGLFADMLLSTEQVDTPVAQLLKIGQADLDRNLAALQAACAQYLPKGSLRACTLKMEADKPKDGPVEAARRQLVALKAFIQRKDLVTIPGTEEALVAEAPPYNRGNSAYINVPGPYDKGVASTYNIAPPDPHWSRKEQAAYIPGQDDLLYTSVHEVWPGHFLQFLHANRNPSRIAALWVGYGYAEGWAHYAEEMMWEEGLGNGDPEQHIGQLTNALLRDVRFLCAIGLHTQGMTVAQSEKMFRDSAFADPADARQQAARGTYDPAYLNYTLGKLMIRKLRADWLARYWSSDKDPRAHWKEFHDQFLSYGGPPIPMVRREMVGEGGSLF